MEIVVLVILFFLIATLYSCAGFGGGSSYLALLSLYAIQFTDLRIVALSCNIVVVLFSTILYQSHDKIPWIKVFPIIILSVPLAFLGGRFLIQENLYFVLLGFTLLIAAILMFISKETNTRKLPKFMNGIVGGSIGFLSGIVGIGGGIFLSPLLYLSRWGKPKVIAATSSVFILVNSIAGLIGQLSLGTQTVNFKLLAPLLVAVFFGGQLGSRLTLKKLKPSQLKKVTAVVIFLVAIRLLWIYLF